jgi:hypothetical protein
MKMAEMYFKEKGMALLARIEDAEEGMYTSATIESSTVPGDIAIQKWCAPDDNMLFGNDSDEDTDDE